MEPMYRYGDLLVWAPTLAFLLVAALISFSRIFERNPATLGLLVAVVFWIWADLTHGFVSDPEMKSLLFYLQFAFLSFIPLTWLGTCFRLAGQTGRTRTVVLSLLAVAAAVQLVELAVDRQFHWFFHDLVLPPGSWTYFRQNGPGYYAFVTVLFSSLVAGVVILARSRPYFSLLDLKRSSLILWGIGVPTVAGIIDVFKLVPIPHLILIPWAILLTSGFFLYALVWGRLFVPTPLAYEIVVKRMPDPVVVMDSAQRPVWFNEAARDLWPELSFHPDKRLDEVFPDLSEHVDTLRAGGEVVVRRDDHQYRVQGSPAQDQRSGFEALAFVFHDITGLKAEQERLEALVEERTALLYQTNQRLESELLRSQDGQVRLQQFLAEKELLLQEVNHRVKNNLQIILSLINLQARRLAPGSAAAEVYAATQGRIRSISLVHDLIYRTEFGNGLDFRVYLEELVKGIGALYSQQETRIEILASSANIQVGVDFSVDFGLVVNELVTNALKHGIVPAGGGVVTVGLERDGSALVLSVRDTGVGLPPENPEGASLGLSLVRSVLKKYRAELTLSSDAGTLAQVRIPWEDS
jgi:two-component sensor histidine kinase